MSVSPGMIRFIVLQTKSIESVRKMNSGTHLHADMNRGSLQLLSLMTSREAEKIVSVVVGAETCRPRRVFIHRPRSVFRH
jgi:hypothetical protein